MDAQALLDRLLKGGGDAGDAELFRAAMLTEMAKMSCEDGMTMQIHPGAYRNHNVALFAKYGPNVGADIPMRTDYVSALKPLLDRVGNRADIAVILFTLDETNYARELHRSPATIGPETRSGLVVLRLAGRHAAFPPPGDGNRRLLQHRRIQRRHPRLFLHSGAARLARRIDAAYLAELVTSHRLEEDEAQDVIVDLAYNLPKAAYKL